MNQLCCKLAQVVHENETINFGGQEVKGQGHRRPKLDFDAWQRYHPRTLYIDR